MMYTPEEYMWFAAFVAVIVIVVRIYDGRWRPRH